MRAAADRQQATVISSKSDYVMYALVDGNLACQWFVLRVIMIRQLQVHRCIIIQIMHLSTCKEGLQFRIHIMLAFCAVSMI